MVFYPPSNPNSQIFVHKNGDFDAYPLAIEIPVRFVPLYNNRRNLPIG